MFVRMNGFAGNMLLHAPRQISRDAHIEAFRIDFALKDADALHERGRLLTDTDEISRRSLGGGERACRGASQEGAKWNEVDLESKIWTVPEGRKKAKQACGPGEIYCVKCRRGAPPKSMT